MDKQTISKVMQAMGRKGGLLGGKAGGQKCMETMTPAERTARAKKAARASAKVRAKKG